MLRLYSLICSACDLLDQSLVWIQVWRAMIQQYISDLIHSQLHRAIIGTVKGFLLKDVRYTRCYEFLMGSRIHNLMSKGGSHTLTWLRMFHTSSLLKSWPDVTFVLPQGKLFYTVLFIHETTQSALSMLKVINWKHQIKRNIGNVCGIFWHWRGAVCVCVDHWMCVLFNQWRLNGWLVMWQIGYLIPPRYFTQYLHELAAVYRDRESSWQDGCVREWKNKNR